MSRLAKAEALLQRIGNGISKRRIELGLSQEELAERSGLHRTYVSDVERGLRNLSILTLDRLATALDIPLGALMLMGSAGSTTKKSRSST